MLVSILSTLNVEALCSHDVSQNVYQTTRTRIPDRVGHKADWRVLWDGITPSQDREQRVGWGICSFRRLSRNITDASLGTLVVSRSIFIALVPRRFSSSICSAALACITVSPFSLSPASSCLLQTVASFPPAAQKHLIPICSYVFENCCSIASLIWRGLSESEEVSEETSRLSCFLSPPTLLNEYATVSVEPTHCSSYWGSRFNVRVFSVYATLIS
jgi:hypothetical protein